MLITFTVIPTYQWGRNNICCQHVQWKGQNPPLIFLLIPIKAPWCKDCKASIPSSKKTCFISINLTTWNIHLPVSLFPWRREWQLTLVFLPGKFHGQRSLMGYSPWGHKQLDTTKQLTRTVSLFMFLLLWECRSWLPVSLIEWKLILVMTESTLIV